MRAINHAMTGAIIGLSIANPVALPLAFASHYVLDSVPHHGHKDLSVKSKAFKVTLAVDTLLCVALVVILLVWHPTYWWLAALCALVAASPDFMWFGDFIASLRGQPRKDPRSRHHLVRLHAWIQWFQKPIGIVVELAWAVLAIVLLVYLIGR